MAAEQDHQRDQPGGIINFHGSSSFYIYVGGK
jgi:hypothetical protein